MPSPILDIPDLVSQVDHNVLLNIINLASDAILFIDENQEILLFNHGAEKAFGYNAVELIGKPLEILLPENIRQRHRELVSQFAATAESAREMNSRRPIQGVRKNGEIFLGEAAISKVKSYGRWIFMVILRDISKTQALLADLAQYQTNLEELVNRRTNELLNANKELEAFSYSVSHDLRSPLRSIDGFSQALIDDYSDKLDQIGRTYLTRLRTASQNMGFLIDNMLVLSRVTQSDITISHVDLSLMAREIIDHLMQREPTRRVNVKIQANMIIQADRSLLRILLDNLLENAFKYTSKREVTEITVGTETQNSELVYYVNDNGVGFDMKYADKLFTAFQRLHSAKEYKGTGIGLATAYRVVKRHGGRIWANATPNQGAKFYFTLNTQPRSN